MTQPPSEDTALDLIGFSVLGDYDGVDHITRTSVDINRADHNGYTALTHAAARGHLHVVKLLLDRGASPEPYPVNSGKDTPLMVAVRSRHFDIVKSLIEAGADPLQLIAASEHKECCAPGSQTWRKRLVAVWKACTKLS